MYRYTTPTIPITVTGADLTNCRVWVTMSQGITRRITREITELKSEASETEWEFVVRLSQAESAKFADGKPVKVQVNVMDSNGFRCVTNIETLIMTPENLMDRTVRHG